MKKIFITLLIINNLNIFGQQSPMLQNVTLKGKIIEKESQQVLEYATVVLKDLKTKKLSGGISNAEGLFSFEVSTGIYDISFEFIGFKKIILANQKIVANRDFGTIQLQADAQNLSEVNIIAEKSTVEIKLDKKIYNVGKDMTVKGGTATDVLENVPSVTVDQDGAISLRGNDNVTILINGKPSGLVGLNGTNALKQLPAEAVEKVEVVTSPSARYDAEGTGGIINIILRRSKIVGFNGSTQLNLGNPDRIGTSANLNFRTNKFNLFTNSSLDHRLAPGKSSVRQENFANFGGEHFLDENRFTARNRNNVNSLVGLEYYISENSSLVGSFLYSAESNTENTSNTSNKFFENRTLSAGSLRNNDVKQDENTTEYSLNYTKNFKKTDHKLTLDAKLENSTELSDGIIVETNTFPNTAVTAREFELTDNYQRNLLFQGDYVLPLRKDGRFEFGFKSTFDKNITDYEVDTLNAGIRVSDANFSNVLHYNENIHAIYSQYGTKFNKLSFLMGLRTEISDIKINLVTTHENFDKNYTKLFPTLNFNYELSDKESFTLGYNRRIRRPRSRFINPFPTRTSATNLFSGNPDIDPAYTSAYELGYMNRMSKLTINSSIYYNHSTGNFTFITEESGDFTDDGIPIIIRMPINLASESRYGFEMGLNYNPSKKWRINQSFNLFKSQTRGDFNGINYDADNTSWFTRFSSKLTLPAAIDFQTTFFYMGPSKTAQGTNDGMFMANLAFSKDILKEKGTLTLNVSDLFNSSKHSGTSFTATTFSESEFQFRQRSINLAFSYRFNQKKKNQQQRPQIGDDTGGDEFGG